MLAILINSILERYIYIYNVFIVLAVNISISHTPTWNRKPPCWPQWPLNTGRTLGKAWGTNWTLFSTAIYREWVQEPIKRATGGRTPLFAEPAGARREGDRGTKTRKSPRATPEPRGALAAGGGAPPSTAVAPSEQVRAARAAAAASSRPRPHAHARLAVAAGRPRAALVWGDAGTKWQRLGHLSCHCGKRAPKTGAWSVGHFPAALSAGPGVRNRGRCPFPRGGRCSAAPLSLATRQAEQVGHRWERGCWVRGWGCDGRLLGRAVPASGAGRPAPVAGVDAAAGPLGPAELPCPPAALRLRRARGGQQPGLSRGLAGPVGQPSPLVQRLPFQPRSALAPPARPRGVQRGLGLRRDAAHLGSDFSQNRERNPNRPSSLSPRVCKGGGTQSSQRWWPVTPGRSLDVLPGARRAPLGTEPEGWVKSSEALIARDSLSPETCLWSIRRFSWFYL